VTIRWFVGLGTGSRPDQQDAQKAVVEAFNASQDKIKLVLEVANYEPLGMSYRLRLPPAAAPTSSASGLAWL